MTAAAAPTFAPTTTAEQRRRFFDTFGFLVVRGALRDDVEWIAEEHAAVFRDLGIAHTGEARTQVVPFIDHRPRLCGLLEHPAVEGLLGTVLGEDFNYIAGDGNYYSGDTGWHPDGAHSIGLYVKLAIYLDPVTAASGALRVIPGSHRHLDWSARQAAESDGLWGVPGSAVPAVALESQPGDLVLFNHNIMHSSWGGGSARRMFTMNCGARARSEDELVELRSYIAHHHVYLMERTHTRLMREIATPRMMRHLEQVMENEGHLAGLAAAYRASGRPPQAHTAGTEA